ncbi:MAG: NAD(+)/NADH kinase [Candidatus Marinimicrobia bacterium]|nr:NAD(+)/NADH kinase [Candidatus Neomarinimicrobiota bacterium]
MTKEITKPHSFGIWGNTDKPKFWELLEPILKWAEQKKIIPFITTRIKDQLPNSFKYKVQVIESADDFQNIDFLLTLGGDGTMLSAARAVEYRETPILGIHLGELGFLAKITTDVMFERLDMVADANYEIQKRMVLKGQIMNSKNPSTFYALNDFVIDRGKSHRLITLRLKSNDRYVADYKADGLIVGTPTGSTAYALSAGGPIIMPKLKAMVVVPISPHTLNLRPIVLPDDRTLEITFPNDGNDGLAFAIDGQVNQYLDQNSKIIIKKAPYDINMIDYKDSNYFDNLQQKMGWGRRGN